MNYRAKLHEEVPILSRAHSTDVTVSETRPRKANSEVRKQQNRIASRNYREKRKRKLQQLQQLLENDGPGEKQAHTRSTSPYDDRSCSGSIGYDRSVASASPHIAAVSGHFSSPQPDHASIASQVWGPSVTSPTQTSLYNDRDRNPVQLATTYLQSGLTTTTCPTWISSGSIASAGYPIRSLPHNYTYPSHTYAWPPVEFDATYTNTVHQQQTTANSYIPTWQYHISDELPAGVAIDPYGRRYHPYEPQ
ncbi:hypothetical protein SVAN01_02567 [Stagonosporopsis vannaccii]|nr:hypothetical protein SVAN01_02567 [Stagonosporopsis vannaccii]